MNSIDPFQNNDFHCHSKFRPPEIEAVEFKARRVWPDWDDYPPYQDQKKRVSTHSIEENKKRVHSDTGERVKKRYNVEIKKTQDEIEEMAKRFRLYDYDDNTPKYRINSNYQSYEFFDTNQNRLRKNQFGAYSTINNNERYYTNHNFGLNSDNDYYANHSFQNLDSSFGKSHKTDASYHLYNETQRYNDQSYTGYEKNENEVDYEITSAATLEAGLLREQNEAMRKRIAYLKQKLEAQKIENKKVLRKIEESEIDRHQMIDFLNSSQNKK